jgi:hypothetical protein
MREDVIEIKSDEDAKVAWELFGNRFHSPKIPTGVKVIFDPGIRKLENLQALLQK